MRKLPAVTPEHVPPIRFVLGRHAEPDDIARVVYSLATGLADYMTGAFVTVDGEYPLV